MPYLNKKFRTFLKQPVEPQSLQGDEYEFVEHLDEEEDIPPLSGELCDNSSLSVNMDVVVFSDNPEDRPWVCRIIELRANGKEFVGHWYKVAGQLMKLFR